MPPQRVRRLQRLSVADESADGMHGPAPESAPESADGTKAVVWRQSDGAPVACEEKLRVLKENFDEVRQICQDAFDDAILMGVDEQQMREALAALVHALKTPRTDR